VNFDGLKVHLLNSLKKEQMEGLFGAEHPLPPSEGPGGGGSVPLESSKN
jgi:hypothetical protein